MVIVEPLVSQLDRIESPAAIINNVGESAGTALAIAKTAVSREDSFPDAIRDSYEGNKLMIVRLELSGLLPWWQASLQAFVS